MLNSGGDDSGSRFPRLKWGEADRVGEMCFPGGGRGSARQCTIPQFLKKDPFFVVIKAMLTIHWDKTWASL